MVGRREDIRYSAVERRDERYRWDLGVTASDSRAQAAQIWTSSPIFIQNLRAEPPQHSFTEHSPCREVVAMLAKSHIAGIVAELYF